MDNSLHATRPFTPRALEFPTPFADSSSLPNTLISHTEPSHSTYRFQEHSKHHTSPAKVEHSLSVPSTLSRELDQSAPSTPESLPQRAKSRAHQKLEAPPPPPKVLFTSDDGEDFLCFLISLFRKRVHAWAFVAPGGVRELFQRCEDGVVLGGPQEEGVEKRPD